MRPQPLIVVKDIAASSRFYERLLGCKSAHGKGEHDEWEYDRLVDPKLHHSVWGSDGLILQLHAHDIEHHHGPMHDPAVPIGNGVLLWFEIDDFDAAVTRVRELGAKIVMDVHVNPGPQHREIWLKDPDGYTVVLCSPDNEAT
jgi:predicted enzyme related to lactoylglutathione lyase